MTTRWSFFALLLVSLLCGCTSFQPSAANRGLSFPLRECDRKIVTKAASDLSSVEAYRPTSEGVCVTGPSIEERRAHELPTPELKLQETEEEAFSGSVEDVRRTIEQKFLGVSTNPKLGIALSGGGSKAAAFAMGVLGGLADTNELKDVDFISSVSGGSYAAYFLYAHEIFPRLRRQMDEPTAPELFDDCVRASTADDVTPALAKRMESTMCPDRSKPAQYHMPTRYRFQAFAGCMQDIFRPSLCTFRHTPDSFGVPFYPIAGTLGFAPLSFVSNTLFDWGLGVSASARTYRTGIGIAYGSSVSDAYEFAPSQAGKAIDCRDGEVLDCDPETLEPKAMTFEELRLGLLYAAMRGQRLPFWIINATAPKHRSGLGWLLAADREYHNDIFELTALMHGSPRYGYVSAPASLHGMTVLDAVAASAAFLDSNEQRVPSYERGFVGVGLHLFNLDWGLDIRNYNVSDGRADFHRVVPYPLNLIDGGVSMAGSSTQGSDRVRSAYIRLIDGGNSEDLGAYSLIKRGVRNIVVSDAAQDDEGKFGDICRMMSILAYAPEGTPRHLYVPGLQNFERHCSSEDDGNSYDVHAWSTESPELLGCLRVDEVTGSRQPCENLGPADIRVFILKPAINVRQFLSTQWQGQKQISSCWLHWEPNTDTNDIRELNCEAARHIQANWNPGACPVFPQNSTVSMTANSSKTLYSAYRELARQYTYRVSDILKPLVENDGDKEAVARFDAEVESQLEHPQLLLKTSELANSCSVEAALQASK